MPNANSTGLILEGISGSGKSTILKELVTSQPYLERGYVSSVVLTEHHTQRVLEEKQSREGLRIEDNVGLLRRNLDAVRDLNTRLRQMPWGEKGRTNHKFCYVFERFHLTHVCHYDHVGWEHVAEIDEELAELGCKLCLLRLEESGIEERVVNSRRSSPGWEAYLSTIGTSVSEVVSYYARQQECFLALAETSAMPVRILDTSRLGVAETVSDVYAFWGLG